MTDYDALKLTFVKSLPQGVVEFLAQMIRCRGDEEKRLKALAKAPAVVMMALGHGVFDNAELQALADAIGAEPDGESEHQLADAIFVRMQTGKFQAELGDRYPAFEEFISSVVRQTEPVLILKTDSKNAISDRAACYFNPEADFETDWLCVDLSIHPDAEIRSDRALTVRLDDYDTGSVSFADLSDFKPTDQWIPLFAHEHVELPSIELEEESGNVFPVEFPDEQFKKPYEQIASFSNLMTRLAFLSHQPPRPPLGAYAQLGGRIYPWPDESVEEQAGRRVVIRTHANSEPWVEVSVDSQDQYTVLPHTT